MRKHLGGESALAEAPQPEAQIGRAASELAALHEASRRLLRLQEPKELAADIIRILERLLTYDFLAVMLIDPKRQILVPFAVSDQGKGDDFVEEDMAYIASARIEVGKGITGWVAEHGQSALVPDVSSDSRYLALRDEIGSELCVPLVLDGRVIGVINAETARLEAFTESDKHVLETVGSQISIAIENAYLFEEVRKARKNAIVADYAAGVFHDLGNLLTAIHIDASQLAGGRKRSASLKKALHRIQAASVQGTKLANRMLHAARPQENQGETQDRANLGKLARENRELIEALAGSHVQVRLSMSDTDLEVALPERAVEQILLNLVVNACQAMPAGGELIVETALVPASYQRGPRAMLRVTDTGSGMTEAVRENAFRSYFSTREGGTGLGLSIVARIVESVDGAAAIDSAPDCGTAVTVHLPLLEQS